MNITLIGCGEVGHCYAQAWQAAGYALPAICELRQDEAMQARAQACGATLHAAPGPWLAESDLVVSAVYGHAARAVAEQAIPYMRGDALYANFTTPTAADLHAPPGVAAPPRSSSETRQRG